MRDYIAQNKIQLGETQYGTAPKLTSEEKTRLTFLDEENRKSPLGAIDDRFGEGTYTELMRLENIRDRSSVSSLYDQAMQTERRAHNMFATGMSTDAQALFNQANHFYARSKALGLPDAGIEKPTKFKQHQLPGGENYREVVLTLPSNRPSLKNMSRSEYNAAVDAADKSGVNDYQSSHWDEPNALAHLRMSDRVTDGKKTLLVDEVQSDWHQAGREQGYKNDIDMPSMSADELLLEHGDRLSSGQKSDLKDFISRWEKASENNDTDRLDRLFEEYDGWAKRQKLQGVPDAPYKDDWYQLALRRAVKEAIDGGYDRVALPTGARVNERFDLSKHIESISHQKNPDGTYKIVAVDKNNRHAMNEMSVPEEKLSSIVGKDVAQKIINAEGTPFPEGTVGAGMTKLSGLDLKVGGEGNIKYYDEVYPNYLKKFGKKYGANVGMTSVQTEPSTDKIFKDVGKYYAYTGQGRDTKEFNTYAEALKFLGIGAEPLHYMEITPAMREAFKTGIHMKRGGKVSFANNIDAMRLALSKG